MQFENHISCKCEYVICPQHNFRIMVIMIGRNIVFQPRLKVCRSTPIVVGTFRMLMFMGRDKDRLDFMTSIGAMAGGKHIIQRGTLYDDVIKLYQSREIVKESPICIAYDSELAVDEGGVTRDMYSAFWEEAYSRLFDGATILVPLIHAQTDMGIFPILGKIISHGYLVSGYLPVRISLPSLLAVLLGPSANVPRSFLLDALMDYISDNERDKLKTALQYKGTKSFPTPEMKLDVISILSRLGCREMPTPQNLAEIIVNVAKYEFCSKPAAAITMIYYGIPVKHRQFWTELGIDGINDLYTSLTVTSDKILKVIDCDCRSPGEERSLVYLTSLIGNMGTNDLRNFLRFTTGSSVCIAKKIKVIFNSSSGLARRPFAHTCSNNLELSVSYVNYHEFSSEWYTILGDTNKWKWCMDSF